MLFYRARLDRPAAALSVSLSPVRPAPAASPAGLGGLVRVVVRHGAPSGPVGVHRGRLHTDLPPGRRLRLAGCQADGETLLLSLATVPARAGRERLADRFRLPFRLTAWGVEAVTGARVELFCIPSVQPGFLLLRGRAVLALETPSARLVRAVSFCRRLAVDLNPSLTWRARAAVEGLDLRVGPGGRVEGWLHVAAVCRGEPGAPGGRTDPAAGAYASGRDASRVPPAGSARLAEPAAVRRVDAAVARLKAEVVCDGLALISGLVALDVAWADRSGRGRWTCREVPFSALMEIAGLCVGDGLEPVAQVERLTRVGSGADARAAMLLGVGLTALRTVHREIGGAWYRMAQVVGQAVATVELDELLFPREDAPGPAEPWRRVRVDVGMAGAGMADPGLWTAMRVRSRRAGGRAALEVCGEPYGAGSGASLRSARSAVRVELPGGADVLIGLAAVGMQAELRVWRTLPGGVEVPLSPTAAAGRWHALQEPVRWVLDAAPCLRGLRCLVRGADGLRHVTLPVPGHGRDSGVPAALTVAGTAVRGVGTDRLWVETGGG